MTEMKWENPPAKKAKSERGKHATFAQALRENPGRWALLLENAAGASGAHQISRGVYVAYRPAGSFEAASRKNPDGTFDIYARFVGAD